MCGSEIIGQKRTSQRPLFIRLRALNGRRRESVGGQVRTSRGLVEFDCLPTTADSRRLLRHSDPTAHLADRLALRQKHIRFTEMVDDLLD